MLRWAKYGARVMTMENVEEIKTWGPLKRMQKKGVVGWYPDEAHTGRTWQAFLSILSTGIDADHPDMPEILSVLDGTVTLAECVRGFGYQYEAREIRACDFGTPTIRRRLFMIARRDGVPIVWPAATHFDGRLRLPGPAWRTIAQCIDWERPCPSIFLTKEDAKIQGINCKRPLADPTLRRIAMGIDRYVMRAETPFLVSLTHQGGERIESGDEPIRTITTAKRGEKGVVAPTISRFNGDHHGRQGRFGTQLVRRAARHRPGHVEPLPRCPKRSWLLWLRMSPIPRRPAEGQTSGKQRIQPAPSRQRAASRQ